MTDDMSGSVTATAGEGTRRKRIMFFTRGRGRGHAVPDLLIAAQLQQLTDLLEVRFVSYGTGATTLRDSHAHVIDLGFTDGNNFFDTLIRATECIREFSPDLVVSHEEFAAVPAAQLAGVRVVFITDWFVEGTNLLMQAVRYAEHVLFIGNPGIFAEPEYLKGRVQYVGNVIRPFEYALSDRLRARDELRISHGLLLVSVIPGAWANEIRSPIFDLVVSAFRDLPVSDKRLVWIGGSDHAALSSRSGDYSFLTVYPHHDPIEQLMVASDVVITKANRGTTMELDELRIPSISLSFGFNPVDDMIVCRLRNNTALNARAVDSHCLSQTIYALATKPSPGTLSDQLPSTNTNAHSVAKVLLEALVRTKASIRSPGWTKRGKQA
jgi:UDP-N-acetylglucosamine:LPS N-acetylglucosamine transferase